jgi:hypothetical protein
MNLEEAANTPGISFKEISFFFYYMSSYLLSSVVYTAHGRISDGQKQRLIIGLQLFQLLQVKEIVCDPCFYRHRQLTLGSYRWDVECWYWMSQRQLWMLLQPSA